jgi:hypothetical protein
VNVFARVTEAEVGAGVRRERIQVMLRARELRVEQARRHEQRMREGLAESVSWAESADREWIAHAATEATADREHAEQSLGAAGALVSEAFPGLDLEAARNVIARCRCGATLVVPVRAARRTLPRTYAHTPGAVICSVCGNTAALDDAAAPHPDQPPKEFTP